MIKFSDYQFLAFLTGCRFSPNQLLFKNNITTRKLVITSGELELGS